MRRMRRTGWVSEGEAALEWSAGALTSSCREWLSQERTFNFHTSSLFKASTGARETEVCKVC